jgi:uncharacterized cupredoxin-like copper-binding protein
VLRQEVGQVKKLLAFVTFSILLLAACGGAGATSGGTVNATLTDSKIVVDTATVPSGKITFQVKNTGTMVHEVVVLKTDLPADKIPPDPDEPGKMLEDGSKGESGDLNVGEAKTFTLDLEPGNYVLMCNQTGHYLLGMHIPFVVK